MSEEMYSERQIRSAVHDVASKYGRWNQKLEYRDIALVENVLMTFEMYLFNGDIQVKDLEELDE